jgi:arsenate reductase
MAEGFLRSFGPELDVYSAGTMAEGSVNPFAVKSMAEEGIDISSHTSDSIDKYVDEAFDYVITVCDGARESCPVFTGNVKKRIHIGFDDPAAAKGSEAEVMPVYRRVRDEIKNEFFNFYNKIKSS